MKDQHEKIKGYRSLTQEEIDLMNEIKEHGEKTNALIEKIRDLRESDELENSMYFESVRDINLAKDYLQTGQMWLVRSVALPESF